MALNGVIAIILRYFAAFGSFRGQLPGGPKMAQYLVGLNFIKY